MRRERHRKRTQTSTAPEVPAARPASARRISALLPAVALLLVVQACGAPLGSRSAGSGRRRGLVDAPSPTFASITAPLDESDGSRAELADLQRLPDHPGALLRGAFILLETQREAESVEPLNLVLYGELLGAESDSSRTETLALARWLRSRAFLGLRETAQARQDLAVARRDARTGELRAAIEATAAAVSGNTGLTGQGPTLAASQIRSRSQWGARPPRGSSMAELRPVRRITIHHSGTPFEPGSAKAAAEHVRSIQRHHQQTNGWSDIGYHFVIDPNGRIWEGRSIRWQGAHAGNPALNRHNVGICLLGNYMPAAQGRPPRPQVRALRALVAYLVQQHDLPHDSLFGHTDLKHTDCPGPYLQVEIARMRSFLKSRRS